MTESITANLHPNDEAHFHPHGTDGFADTRCHCLNGFDGGASVAAESLEPYKMPADHGSYLPLEFALVVFMDIKLLLPVSVRGRKEWIDEG